MDIRTTYITRFSPNKKHSIAIKIICDNILEAEQNLFFATAEQMNKISFEHYERNMLLYLFQEWVVFFRLRSERKNHPTTFYKARKFVICTKLIFVFISYIF